MNSIMASFTSYRIEFRADTPIVPLRNVTVKIGAIYRGTKTCSIYNTSLLIQMRCVWRSIQRKKRAHLRNCSKCKQNPCSLWFYESTKAVRFNANEAKTFDYSTHMRAHIRTYTYICICAHKYKYTHIYTRKRAHRHDDTITHVQPRVYLDRLYKRRG